MSNNTHLTLPSRFPAPAIGFWLLGCAGLVFIMVLVGAITRLTESGLSMVEWRPLIGALPPMSEAEWQRVFDLYKQTPEFQKENFWMGLSDFQTIFFWEWAHRLMGRLIGLAYGLPLFLFWVMRKIPKGFGWPLLGMLFLGGAQGYMGWFMVQSGLVNEPAVSHYRLAAHLSLAFLIMACLVTTALRLNPQWIKNIPSAPLTKHLWVVAGFYILTVFWGAYTAGLDAGLLYNDTFPKMGDYWVPYEMHLYSPLFVNFFENHAVVQFAHRWLAIITFAVGAGFTVHTIKRGALSMASALLGLAFLMQIGLGITTLFTHVHIIPATAHQGTALLILILIAVNFAKYQDNKA